MAKKKNCKKAYDGVVKAFGGPVRGIFKIKAYGTENIPRDRGVLICPNHTALWDVLVMSASTDVQIRYMAKKELFKIPVLGWLIKALGAFPVDRKGGDVAAIRKTVSILGEGSHVGIFPQGTRHPHEDPRGTEVRHGVGLIAYRAKCDVLPVFIKTKGHHVSPFKKTEIYFGEPIPFEDLGFSEGGKDEYKKAAELIFDRVCTIGESLDGSKNG